MKWLLLLTAASAGWSAESWPQFRGVNASGVSTSTEGPLRWNGEKGENILWKTAIPGLGLSSPVVYGDRLYITSAISADASAKVKHGLYGTTESHADTSKHQWKVYAIDRKTGKIAWEQTAAVGAPKTTASESDASKLHTGHRRHLCRCVLRQRGTLHLFRRWQAALEERPWHCQRGLVFRTRLRVGYGQFADSL